MKSFIIKSHVVKVKQPIDCLYIIINDKRNISYTYPVFKVKYIPKERKHIIPEPETENKWMALGNNLTSNNHEGTN